MRRMVRLGYGLLIVLVFCLVAVSHAQTPVTLESAQVELWPEYDRPEMLVILAGTLPAATQLPATLTVRLPPAGTLHAAAMKDAQGELVNATYSSGMIDGSTVVTLTLTQPNFHLEYYDGGLVSDGSHRRYTFTWPAEWATAAARVRVQEPAGASNLTVTPTLSPAGSGDFGLDYLAGDLGAIGAGQAVRIDLSYDKISPALSSETAPTTSGPPAAGSSLLPAPVVVGLAVLVGAVVLGIWLWNRQRRPAGAAARRRAAAKPSRAPASNPARTATSNPAPPRTTSANPAAPASPRPDSSPPAASSSPASTAPRFCTQCGQPLQPGDRFCRVCGTAVRST